MIIRATEVPEGGSKVAACDAEALASVTAAVALPQTDGIVVVLEAAARQLQLLSTAGSPPPCPRYSTRPPLKTPWPALLDPPSVTTLFSSSPHLTSTI